MKLSLRGIEVVEEAQEAAMAWPRRRRGGEEGEDGELLFLDCEAGCCFCCRVGKSLSERIG